jgi:eukaryotic-like serine/threonine-protein kinase
VPEQPQRLGPERWRAVSPHLDRAFDLAGEERDAFLRSLREQDPQVAADLETLLARREALSRDGFLEDPVASWPDRTLAGQTIGAYTLRSLIGQGGMGSVWLAERSDGRFQGQAAVKLLNLALLSPTGQERFRREGSMLARLTDPGIARLLDAGVSPGGQPYLVLEYVEGQPIGAFAAARGLDTDARIGLVLQVLAAVGHAHANLIVHRDIKPSNILVTAEGTAKLLDFGIGKLLGGEEESLTRDDRALTLEYAAPEQMTGGAITTATDTHAIGLLLYELLTGRRAYETKGRTPSEVERLVCQEVPTRPSQVMRGVGGDLDAIVMKALRKEPGRRYPSAATMEDDLRRYLDGRPVLARPDSTRYRFRKFVGRHRTGVAVGMAIAALLVAGAVRERALRARAEAEARKAAAVKDYLVTVFEVSDPFGRPDPHGGEATARTLLDRGASRLDASLAGQPEALTELRGVLGWVYSRLGAFDSAARLLERALAEKRALYGNQSLAVAEAADRLGDALGSLNRFDEAEPLLREALAIRRQRLGDESAETAKSLDSLATLLQARNDYVQAEALFREALALRRAIYGNAHRLVAESLNNLGVLLYLRGRYDEAEPLYREALAVHLAQRGEEHPLTTITMQNLAQVQSNRGEVDESIALYRRSLASKRKILGNTHPNVTIHLNNLGITLANERHELAEAEALIREALAGDRQTFGERHSYVAESLDNLATVLRLKGDFDEAERTYRQALEMNRGLFGAEHARIGKNLGNLAMTRHARGDLPGALGLYRESIGIYERLVGRTHPRYLTLSIGLGKALRESGQALEAEAILREIAGRLDPANSVQRGPFILAQVALGQALVARGRANEARPLLERALPLARQRFGDRDWRTGEASLALGACLAAAGEYERAEPLLRDASERLEPQARARPALAQAARTALESVRVARSRDGASGRLAVR